MSKVYLLYFYVPNRYKEKVKLACFNAGAGKIGLYEQCSFEYGGKGQFKPMNGSNPFLGKKNALSKISEIKVEMIVHADKKNQVLKSLKKAHPYEEPAYGFIKITT